MTQYDDESIGMNDDPFAEIMGEGEQSEGSQRYRYINQVGKTGRYIVGGFKELEDEELAKLSQQERTLYEIEAKLAERKKFKAIILYNPEDVGRALWPDDKIFKGKEPLCQSERSAAPYDVARQKPKMAALDRAALKGMGHTGACSTCKIGTDLCKVRNVAYIIDLDHLKLINEANAAMRGNEEPLIPTFSKLDSKGPQSTWNFRGKYKELKALAKKENKDVGHYIVEFSAEEGSMSSYKVTFKIIGQVDPALRPMVMLLAREALLAAKAIRKPFTALPGKTETTSLPPGNVETADGVIIPEEIPF